MALHRLLRKDPRFPLDAYLFVREALAYAADELNLGNPQFEVPVLELEEEDPDEESVVERHLTGQELCEAIRQFAIDQFGYMARIVLSNWGIAATSHFGDIVYNMIDVGLMKKSPHDCRSHFDDVYDFDEVFDRQYQMKI
jgi:uncharacterized repeat protein (TIGR04138 family)